MYKIADIADFDTCDDEEEMSQSGINKHADELMKLIENTETDQETRREAVRDVRNYMTSENQDRVTALLVEVVQDKNEEKTIRLAAGNALSTLSGEQVSEVLIELLGDDTEDPALHVCIQDGITSGGCSQVKSNLAKIFTSQSQSETTRTRVGACLWNTLEKDKMRKVLAVFQDPTESLAIRKSAASILAFQDDASVDNASVIDILEASLKSGDSDPEVRAQIAESVDWRQIARTDVPVRILRDRNEPVELRMAVIINFVSSLCVNEESDANLADILIEILDNPSEEPQIRSEVCEALEKEFASPEAKQAIKNYKAGLN